MSMSYDAIQQMMTAPGQAFEMEQVNCGGRAFLGWKNAPANMSQILQQSRQHGDAEFIVYQDERISYRQHYHRVAALSRRLIEDFGIVKGDRVAIAMRNYPEWLSAFWATVCVGAVAVPLNAWWTGEELGYGLRDSGSRLVFADGERLSRLQGVRGSLPDLEHIVAVRCDSLPRNVIDYAGLVTGPDAELPAIDLQPDDDATIFYTSGTTGFPKGTLGSHRNFCSVPLTLAYMGVQTLLRSGGSLQDLAAMQKTRQTTLLTVPLFHVTGCHGAMLGTLNGGGKLVMMYKWDPEEALALIERERVTLFSGVPTMAWQLLEVPGFDQRDLSSLASIGYGGAPAAPEILRRVSSSIPAASASSGWGITETSAGISMIGGLDYREKPDSVGRPVPVCEVKVVDATGLELASGDTGELWVRGPNVAQGYWHKPEATAESFVDGWFRTGDLGWIDHDGCIYIVDRIKDMIIRGGENVYCAEVEAALLEHPAVRAASVFGVPHTVLGEEVGAVVQVTELNAVSPGQLREHLAGRLAGFKIPAHFWLIEEPLPVGATGKIQKRELKEHYTPLVEQAGG